MSQLANDQLKTQNYHEPSLTFYFVTCLLWAEVC